MATPFKFFCSKLNSQQSFDKLQLMITNGMLHINPCFTPEYLAGQYAYWQSTEKNKPTIATLKAELKFLRDLGATFDFDLALNEAEHFLKIMQIEFSKAIWI